MLKFFSLFVFHVALMRLASSQFVRNAIVETSNGQIMGKMGVLSDVVEYLGVPYAEPPLGALRFQPPVEKTSFNSSKPYDATYHREACVQDAASLQNYLSSATTTDEGLSLSLTVTPSEDCLYLNIYTPVLPDQQDANLPVMVFVHGGNFIQGTGSAYKGFRISRDHDVVVATINYRLGVFGFLSNSTENFPGNNGLLDQKMALDWIKNNIKSFGGNANSITMFGEEAGGSSVHAHLLQPDQSLFQRAIVQSAHYDDGVWTEMQCKDQFKSFVARLGFSVSDPNLLSYLQTLNQEPLLAASQQFQSWRPCVHPNHVVENSPQNVIQGNDFKSDIHLLIGTNSEVISNTDYDVAADDWLFNITREIITSSFPQQYGNITNDVIEKMAKNYLNFYSILSEQEMTEEERRYFVERTFSDQLYKTWAQEVSWATSKNSLSPVYNYLFTKNFVSIETQPAPLSSELPYIFGYISLINLEEQRLSNLIMTLWTNFAKSGNPNLPNATRIDWPEYETYNNVCRSTLNLQAVGSSSKPHEVTSRSWDFWQQYYELMGFSCVNATQQAENDEGNPQDNEVCEASVKDVIGMNVTNEEAAIMLIAFISLACLFLLVSMVTSVCCCLYKKRLKKMKKKNKKSRGSHDNPVMSEYKL